MSVLTEIQRIKNAKESMKLAIDDKGLSVPSSADLDEIPSYIDRLASGIDKPRYVESLSLDDNGFLTGTLVLNNLPTSIPDFTFYFNKITSVSMPNVTSIGNNAFGSCSSLVSVSMPNVTDIGQYVFNDCYKLASVSMPNVTSIGRSAFYRCYKLASVSMPNVTSIGQFAFYRCTSLASVSMPNVTDIGQYVFNDCYKLASIDIPSTVTSIGNNAFQSCSSLASVTCRATMPPTLGTDVFSDTSSSLVIYVPAESVDAYKAANNWSTYADRIQAIP